MILAGLALGIVILIFSLYLMLIANDAVGVGAGILRVVVTVIGLNALRFSDTLVLASSVFLYAFVSIFVLAAARKEVQVKP